MAKSISKNSLSVYDKIDPDALYEGPYKAASFTLLYVPKSRNLYVKPYPTNHRDMMSEDDIFDDVYAGRRVSTERERASLASRGQVLIHTNSLLGRIGLMGDAIILSLWTDPTQEMLGNFLSKLFEKFPNFKLALEKLVLVSPQAGARMLAEVLGGKKSSAKRAVSLKPRPEKPAADARRYEIGGRTYTLSDLQSLRSAIHTHGEAGPGLSGPMGVLCHPDMEKYPELQGYRPANCNPGSQSLRPTHPENWRQAGRSVGLPYTYSYGESTSFRDWIGYHDLFR